ncbi:MAG: M28 family peptidase, partial [Planctomycetota bacterium]
LAAAGIEARLKAAGLEPAFVIDGQATYRQPVELELPLQATRQTLLVSGAPQPPGRAFEALGMSPDASFAGEAVFVGYAIEEPERNYNSFAGLGPDGLKGKVAVALRYEPVTEDKSQSRWARGGERWTPAASFLRKAQAAADRGAVAMLIVDPVHRGPAPLRTAADTDTSERAPIPVIHISSMLYLLMLEHAGVGADIWEVYEDLANRGELPPEAWPGVEVRGEVELDRPTIATDNVGALAPGRGDLADQVIVVGAHYDHVGEGRYGSRTPERAGEAHLGADDNASGTAALMIAARKWVERPASQRGEHERAVAFVAFTAEERGLIGSAHLTTHPEELGFDLDRAAAMLNFDMVGRLRPDGLHLLGAGSGGDALRKAIGLANANHGLTLKQTDSPFGPSDHASFARRRIPSVMLFTGLHGDYHTPDDTTDKIHRVGGARVTSFALELLQELVAVDPGPVWTATEPARGSGGAPRFRVYLGVAPDYGSDGEVDGVPISGVTPGSPADDAGLRAGDAIVSWDGREIESLRDLMAELGRSEPGPVTLGVMRDGEPLETIARVEPVGDDETDESPDEQPDEEAAQDEASEAEPAAAPAP